MAEKKRIRGHCIDCGKGLTGWKAQRCRPCNTKFIQPLISREEYARNWQLKKKYGLEFGEFEALWTATRGRCFICNKQMKWPTKTKGQGLDVVAVDHDHKTGKVRGLLCNACNKALGFFKDDPELIFKAYNYLSVWILKEN